MKFLLNKIVYIALPLIIFTAIFISSCTTDNTVIPPPDPVPDTASYYNWQKFESNADFGEVFVNDSNNVWIATVFRPIVFNGNTFEYLKPINNFFLSNMSVVNKDNSFWIGNIDVNSTVHYPSLIKYTNGNQEFFIIDSLVNDGNHSGYGILALNENQALIGINPSPYVYFFNNGKITKHNIGFHFRPQFKKWNNSVYCFVNNYYDSSSFMTTFKFNESTFDSIRTEPLAFIKGNPGITEVIYSCGRDLINLNNQHGTYYFTDNGWQIHTVFPSNGFYGAWKVGGVSKDSLSFFSSYPYDMYNWNGVRFRRQNNFNGFIGFWGLNSYYSNIVNFKGRLYFTVNIQEGLSSYSYLVIGKPKN